jgi:hypothetical protein
MGCPPPSHAINRTKTSSELDCSDKPAAAKLPQPSCAGGGADANAGANPQPQHAGWACWAPNRPTHTHSTQRRLTQQISTHWPQFKVLRQRYAGTRFEERRQLHLPRNTRQQNGTPLSEWK